MADPIIPILRPGMQLVNVLPPGDWQLLRFRGFMVALCPQHPPFAYVYIPDEVSNDT